jgi:hypothetical protein
MALPFRRSNQGDEGAPVCAASSPMQRLWEVQVLLCTLSPELREALFLWLFHPTDLRRWQPPARFERQRQPIAPADLDQDDALGSMCKLLRDELSAMRQTLDFPPQAMSGLTRNGLLTMHAIRLRQLEGWLWPRLAAWEIKKLIA